MGGALGIIPDVSPTFFYFGVLEGVLVMIMLVGITHIFLVTLQDSFGGRPMILLVNRLHFYTHRISQAGGGRP